MRAFFSLLVTFVCLATGTLSASSAQKISSLPIGKNIFKGVNEVQIGVSSKDPKYVLYVDNVPVSLPKEVAFEEYLTSVLNNLPQPKPGKENAWYSVHVSTDWVVNGGTTPFQLEKTDSGWKIPDVALNFEWTYAGVRFETPGLTGFEFVEGEKVVFSTITGENLIGGTCNVPASRANLPGYLSFGQEFVSPGESDRQLVLFEGDRFVTFDGNGVPLKWSEEPPSFFRPPEFQPLTLAIVRDTDGNLTVSVTGSGAEYAIIEETTDLLNWEVAYSLSSPPTLTSKGVRKHTIVVGGEKAQGLFYRARAIGLQKFSR